VAPFEQDSPYPYYRIAAIGVAILLTPLLGIISILGAVVLFAFFKILDCRQDRLHQIKNAAQARITSSQACGDLNTVHDVWDTAQKAIAARDVPLKILDEETRMLLARHLNSINFLQPKLMRALEEVLIPKIVEKTERPWDWLPLTSCWEDPDFRYQLYEKGFKSENKKMFQRIILVFQETGA